MLSITYRQSGITNQVRYYGTGILRRFWRVPGPDSVHHTAPSGLPDAFGQNGAGPGLGRSTRPRRVESAALKQLAPCFPILPARLGVFKPEVHPRYSPEPARCSCLWRGPVPVCLFVFLCLYFYLCLFLCLCLLMVMPIDTP